MKNTYILIINGGSSSIKFAMFDASASLQRVLEGRIERIGLTKSIFVVKGLDLAANFSRQVSASNHTDAVKLLMDWLEKQTNFLPLTAVGHRVVHGGPSYFQPQRITSEMIKELRQISSFDPEHLPEEILLMEAFHHRFQKLGQIACFDTAFHHDMPRVAQLLPIPRRYEAQGIRRYGFHGLSYAYLMQELKNIGGPKGAKGRIILAHLGSGASMAAVRDGHCLDTTMAFTPAAGLVMGTRCGDIDPGLVSFLERKEQMSAWQFDQMVNHKSGLLGISETSSDMQDLLGLEKMDIRAAEAVELFCYQAKKWIGAYATVLGGLDTLVFSGGIGENSSPVRARICEGLDFLGIELNEKANCENAEIISTDECQTCVRVIRTNEELMIARSIQQILGCGK